MDAVVGAARHRDNGTDVPQLLGEQRVQAATHGQRVGRNTQRLTDTLKQTAGRMTERDNKVLAYSQKTIRGHKNDLLRTVEATLKQYQSGVSKYRPSRGGDPAKAVTTVEAYFNDRRRLTKDTEIKLRQAHSK